MKFIKKAGCLVILLVLTGCPLFQDKSVASSKGGLPNVNTAALPTVTPSNFNKNGEDLSEGSELFKPKDWFTLTEIAGDINGDGKDDLVAVYSQDDPKIEKGDVSSEDGEAARLLVIAVRKSDGKFKRVFSGSKIIFCRYCGGMLNNIVPDIKIANRRIYIYQDVLANFDIEYYLEITLKSDEKVFLAKGLIKSRERTTRVTKKNVIKTPMPLNDFDINVF